MSKLVVPKNPCSSCPYRRDHPSGVWAHNEYEKLRGYADSTEFAAFHCHQENATGEDTVCRGWLSVECESVAARLAVLDGKVTDEERYAEVTVELYDTGAEAADAGQEAIEEPDPDAVRMVDRLLRKGAGR